MEQFPQSIQSDTNMYEWTLPPESLTIKEKSFKFEQNENYDVSEFKDTEWFENCVKRGYFKEIIE